MSVELEVSLMPTYLDGGGGNMWKSREVWEEIFAKPGEDIAVRRFIRVSDLLELLKQNKIKFK